MGIGTGNDNSRLELEVRTVFDQVLGLDTAARTCLSFFLLSLETYRDARLCIS